MTAMQLQTSLIYLYKISDVMLLHLSTHVTPPFESKISCKQLRLMNQAPKSRDSRVYRCMIQPLLISNTLTVATMISACTSFTKRHQKIHQCTEVVAQDNHMLVTCTYQSEVVPDNSPAL